MRDGADEHGLEQHQSMDRARRDDPAGLRVFALPPTGTWADFHFDAGQRLEIILTLLQTGLGLVLLANMEFDWFDATALFVLWWCSSWRPICATRSVAYALWIVIPVGAVRDQRAAAARVEYFRQTLAQKRSAGPHTWTGRSITTGTRRVIEARK